MTTALNDLDAVLAGFFAGQPSSPKPPDYPGQVAWLRESAETTRSALRRGIEVIRSDERLTPETKAAEIATLRKTAQERLRDLSEQELSLRGSTRTELERRLFAAKSRLSDLPGTDRESRAGWYRDALDRADATDPTNADELRNLMTRAVETDDALLARAALRTAFARSELDAINVYCEYRPDEEPHLQQLWDVTAEMARIDQGLDSAYGLDA